MIAPASGLPVLILLMEDTVHLCGELRTMDKYNLFAIPKEPTMHCEPPPKL